MRTIIILTGPEDSGKTTLAKLLTCDGQTGIYFDIEREGNPKATKVGISQMLQCPRVVICSFTSNVARGHPLLQELFRDARTLVVNVSKGDSTPLVPTWALASPPKFREWLLNHGNHTFSGGQTELNEIIEKLPPYGSLRDLYQLNVHGNFPALKMANAERVKFP
jgi:hypothetical protein